MSAAGESPSPHSPRNNSHIASPTPSASPAPPAPTPATVPNPYPSSIQNFFSRTRTPAQQNDALHASHPTHASHNTVSPDGDSARTAPPPRNGNQNSNAHAHGAEDEMDEQEFGEDLQFYLAQIYAILKPVAACIVLSVLWVKVIRGGGDDGGFAPSSYQYIGGSTDYTAAPPSQQFFDSLANALIILSQIVVATIVIVLLFYFNCMKVLFGIFGLVVASLLGLFGYDLLAAFCYKLDVPLDWPATVFMVWNLAVGGVTVIFWKGPLWVQQCYLVLMSSLMAFSFTGLMEWTTWILLGLLAAWDLFAVLSPYGPLRILVESSRQHNREIPGLLYTAMVWMMASGGPADKSSSPVSAPAPAALTVVEPPEESGRPPRGAPLPLVTGGNGISPEALRATTTPEPDSPGASRAAARSAAVDGAGGGDGGAAIPMVPARGSRGSAVSAASVGGGEDTGGALWDATSFSSQGGLLRREGTGATIVVGEDGRSPGGLGQSASGDRQQRNGGQPEEEEEDEEDEERSGLKLGLGDFVFYSVMVSRAALFTWPTTVTTAISAITGLTMTIFLLAIFRKALPALPISIALGLVFYFATRILVIPYLDALIGFQATTAPAPGATQGALAVGKVAGGMVFI
ncbi:Presenilin-domain-containing protein [Gonapodya prolifera JEL478]|uniref:Presenilin n=1 Tax=Gonapodya prolifera (strain JEL478) TaxID=1344416 RepID=A0A138ZYD5_GONPJ|nr:Presenilin-domain-containing protein [Gonapodya prolifera JEL478]|eukprot:KXS09481.1 Presenilin-domain-containing protein [Gonapodya prolifera JEL478]